MDIEFCMITNLRLPGLVGILRMQMTHQFTLNKWNRLYSHSNSLSFHAFVQMGSNRVIFIWGDDSGFSPEG